ncbi:MAG: aldo/keto reductase [FCB group bacterium]|jgi:predicted aldo/keto reductase-like oxidoreductase|nr:aldo/keto reductase [FCB group bacterium]
MKYRRFGKTEERIPVISCGGMRFQESWKSGDPVSDASQRNLEACVRHAFELGVNHFETARGYGTSEYQLGKILPTMPRNEIIVQTKVGPESDPAQFVANFELSMELLGLDHVELFAIHGVNNEECYEDTLRCLDYALAWKKQGRIKSLGFSTHGPTDVIVKTIALDVFDYVNLHWYYIFQDNWPAVVEANKRDMGVFIISPNDKGGLLYKPTPKFTELCAPYHPMVFNGLFCLSRPEVHTLSCGVAKPEDFDIHVETGELSDRAAELVAPVVKRLDEEMERALGKEWLETWYLGLPEWEDTPANINIPTILRLRNLVLAFEMVEYGKMRYNLLGNGGHWFPGRNAAKLGEVDLSDCLRGARHAARIPALIAETHGLLSGEEVKRLQRN